MPARLPRLAVLLLSLLLLPPAHADTFTGKVVRILDGDTVEVLVDRAPRRVRLAGIDAPEKAQPFGARAKQRLAELVGGQAVEVDWHKTDRYGRTVGKLISHGRDVNLAMVSSGMAWWYRRYADEQAPADRVIYEAAERQARTERRGLWTDATPGAAVGLPASSSTSGGRHQLCLRIRRGLHGSEGRPLLHHRSRQEAVSEE